MDRGLVLVSKTVLGQELLGTAAALAASEGTDLVLYHLGDPASEDVRQAIDRVASRELPGRDVEYTVAVDEPTGDVTEQLVAAAEEHGCDRLFLSARPQSGLRSLVGRDPIARVVEAFDGLVTVGGESGPQGRASEGVHSPENIAEYETSNTLGYDSGM